MAKHSFYRVEIDRREEEDRVIYFRKCVQCTTAKGMDRQHNRIVNETCDAWREKGFHRLTVYRVPADVVVRGDIRKV